MVEIFGVAVPWEALLLVGGATTIGAIVIGFLASKSGLTESFNLIINIFSQVMFTIRNLWDKAPRFVHMLVFLTIGWVFLGLFVTHVLGAQYVCAGNPDQLWEAPLASSFVAKLYPDVVPGEAREEELQDLQERLDANDTIAGEFEVSSRATLNYFERTRHQRNLVGETFGSNVTLLPGIEFFGTLLSTKGAIPISSRQIAGSGVVDDALTDDDVAQGDLLIAVPKSFEPEDIRTRGSRFGPEWFQRDDASVDVVIERTRDTGSGQKVPEESFSYGNIFNLLTFGLLFDDEPELSDVPKKVCTLRSPGTWDENVASFTYEFGLMTDTRESYARVVDFEYQNGNTLAVCPQLESNDVGEEQCPSGEGIYVQTGSPAETSGSSTSVAQEIAGPSSGCVEARYLRLIDTAFDERDFVTQNPESDREAMMRRANEEVPGTFKQVGQSTSVFGGWQCEDDRVVLSILGFNPVTGQAFLIYLAIYIIVSVLRLLRLV